MDDRNMERGQLIDELKRLRRRVAELEAAESQHRVIEESLHVSEIKYRNLFNNAQAGLFRTRISDGKLLDCNEKFVEITGFSSKEELIARGISSEQYVNPADRESIVTEMKEKGYVNDVVVQTRRRDGTLNWVSYSAYIYPKSDCIEGVVIDITERKKAEEELRKSEERFRALIESSFDFTIILDAQGNITYLSPNIVNLWGRGAGELLGRDMYKYIHPDDIPAIGERFVRLLKKPKETEQIQLRAQHVDGTWRVLDVVAHNQLANAAVGGIVVNFRDVTERKKAEEALQESEKRYRMFAENASDALWIMDMKFNLTYHSGGERIFGYTAEEMLKRPVDQRMTPESVQTAFKVLQEELAIEQLPDKDLNRKRIIEVAQYHKNGSIVYTEETVSFLRDKDGKAIGITGITRDVTERKKAEDALRESEEKYSTLVENATDGVAIIQDKVIKFANKRMAEMSGYTVEELTGMSSFDLVPKDFIPELEKRNLQREQNRAVEEIFYTKMLCKDGTVKDMESATRLIQYEGRPAVIGIVRDITERRRMENALRESEEKYRTLILNIRDAIFIIKDGKIKYANEGFARITDYSMYELIGKRIDELVAPEDLPMVADRYARRMKGEKVPSEYEFRLVKKDGETRVDVVMDVGVISYEGGPAAMGIGKDITERKRAEAALRESEEKYRLLAENASDVIMLMDMNAKPVYFSPSVTRLLGYSLEEALYGSMEGRMTPASMEKALKHFMVGLDRERQEPGGSRGQTLELEMIHKNGSIVVVEMMVSFIRDESGKPTGMMAILRDVTERKQAENDLKFKEMLLDVASDSIIVHDSEGKIVYANEMANRMRGYTRGEIVGKDIHELATPEYAKLIDSRIQEVMQKGAIIFESSHLRKDETAFPVEVHARVIDIDGSKYVIRMGRDITERKRAEAEMIALSNAFKATLDPVLILDMEGNVRNTNEAARKLFEREEVGVHALEAVAPEDREMVGGVIEELIKTGQPAVAQFNIVTRSGRRVPMEASGKIMLDASGRPAGIVVVERDLTERRQAEGRQKLAAEVLGILNEPLSLPDAIGRILNVIKQETGFYAVGIRLRKDEDFPYFIQNGFSKDFLLTENTIVERGPDGGICRGKDGRVSLECTCGLVISGKTDPSNPLFTPGGSAWTNDALPILDLPEEQDPRHHPRNRCIHAGFQSVALMPIRSGNEIVGLLQINDRRKGCFTLEMIHFFEGIAASIGVALMRKQTEDALRESETKMRSLFEVSPDVIMNIDREGKILFINRATTRAVKETIGTPVYDYIPTEYQSLYAETVENVFRTGKPDRIETKGLGPGKRMHWYEARLVAMKSGDEIESLMVVATDITDRRNAEEALRESEEKFRTAFDNANTGMCLVGLTGNLIKVNDKMSEMFGYSVEELERMTVSSITHPDDRELTPSFMEKAIGGQVKGINFEKRYLTKDGRMVWGLLTSALVHDADGEPLYFISQVQDITDRRRAEEALRESEERLRVTLEVTQIGVWEWNVKDDTWYASPTYYTMLGYEPVTGPSDRKVWLKRGHPDDLEMVTNKIKDVLNGVSDSYSYEARIRHADGSFKWNRVIGHTIEADAEGKPIRLAGVRVDITERKKAEEALQDSEEKFRQITENMLDAVSMVDDKGIIRYASPSHQRIVGYKPEELAGRSVFDFVHPEDVEGIMASLGNIYEKREARYQYRFRHADGHYIWGEASAKAIVDDGGKISHFVIASTDITQRKVSEDALKQSEAKYKDLFEHTLLGMEVIDGTTGRIMLANHSMTMIFGFKSPDDMVGIDAIKGHILPEDMDWVQQQFAQALADPTKHDMVTLRAKTVDGRIIWVTGTATSYIYEGKLAMLISVIDVTAAKETQEKLRESEDRITSIVSTSQEWIWAIDSTGCHSFSNPAIEKILGYRPDEIIGHDVVSMIHADDAATVRQLLSRCIKLKIGWANLVLRWKHKDGSYRYLESNAVPIIDSNGVVSGFQGTDRDITERKMAEEALIRISKAVEGSSDAIGMSDPQGHHYYHNRAFTELFEYTPEELHAAGDGPAAFANRHVARKVFDTIMGGGSWSGEVEMVSRSGRRFTVLERADAIKDESGKVIGLVGVHTDITERKKAEEKLRETRDYMENLIEHANVPMVVWAPDFRITRFNRAFERLTGMKAKSVIGKDLEILFPKGTRDRSMSFIRTAMKGARWEVVEIPIANVDGDVRTVLWNISPIWAEDGKTPIAIIAQGQDITERKKAEEALRESEELSRSMLDNAAMGIYLLQKKKFIYVNPTFEKIIGYSSEELLGQEPINYVHPDDRDQVRDKAVENIKGISVMPYEFRALRKDGKQIWVMERVTPVRYKGKRAVLASFMETTEHKKAEVELERAYEELKTAHERMVQSEKLRAMGEMASGIAHDFNNMLAVILGRTQLVIDDVKDDKVRKGIQIIEQAAMDAAKTVKRLQDFARIRVEHPFEPLDVNEVVEGVLKMVESRRVELEQTKGIAIKIEQGLGKVGKVSGDAAELREALLNILFNSLDAMPTGGKLIVKSEQEEEWVQITIKDTGVGIPDKVKTKVFQPFFTTKASKGSGLGLSVTYGIISRHNGMIKFDSEVGKGTTFYIRLPLAVEEAKKQTKKGKAAAVKPASILAVDDEPEVLKALGLTLEYFGHWVKDFTSGAEALKAFKDGKYDLVITDLGMPGMSGWDVARAVKKIKPDIPVLLITGWVIDLDEEKKKLVDGVIAKPFSRESIASAISAVYPAKRKSTAKKAQAVKKSAVKKKGSAKKKAN